jgi:uncharacterized protein YbjT (DUF2867 family)
MNAMIAGVTGLIGAQALKLLLEDPQVLQVISVSRKSVQPHPKLKQIVITFDALENEQLPKADVALCALGTTIKAAGSQDGFKKVDHDYIVTYARAAKRAGVRKFIVISALGADPDSKVFYNRVKGETEKRLREIGFESLIILQPSLLLGERKDSRPAEKAAIKLEPLYKHLLIGPLQVYRPVRASHVAQVMVQHALDPRAGSRTLTNIEIHEH